MTTALVKFEEAKRALAEARSIDEVKQIRDKAEALRLYVKQQGDGLEMQNDIAEIKLRAERRAGELLAEMELPGRGGGDTKSSSSVELDSLSDLGISKSQSHRWQTEAALPEETFEQHVAETKAKGKELTSAGLYRLAKSELGKQNSKEPEPALYPAEKSPLLIVGRAEAMPQIEDASIDLIITSPPYNLGQDNWPMGSDGRIPRDDGIGYDTYGDGMPEGRYQEWQIQCLAEMWRVAKQGASLFYNHKVRNRGGEIIHPLDWLRRELNPWILRQEIIWDRGSTHNHSPSLFWPHDERIYWMTKGKPILPNRPIGDSTIWRFHGPVAGTWHPAPFCEELPKRCIEAIGREGITVLDPFAGSCTTLRVALQYGYDAIGIDMSQEYLDKAARENGWMIENAT